MEELGRTVISVDEDRKGFNFFIFLQPTTFRVITNNPFLLPLLADM